MQVIAVDDHPLILNGIHQLVENFPLANMAGLASTISELRELLAAVACDVLIMDYSMPRDDGADGIVLIHKIQRQYPDLKIIVLTMQDNPAVVRALKNSGLSALLSKRDPLHHITTALQRITVGMDYVSPSMCDLLRESQNPVAGGVLSVRETEVLRFYAAGMNMTEVAKKINRSVKTSSAHKVSAMRKLGVKNDAELHTALRDLGIF